MYRVVKIDGDTEERTEIARNLYDAQAQRLRQTLRNGLPTGSSTQYLIEAL